MNLTLEDWTLWAAGFIGFTVLLAALSWKGAARVFPWFTGWCCLQVFRTAVLFSLHSTGHDSVYSYVFWWAKIPELLLQLGVIANIALLLFRLRGKWIPGTKPIFRIGSVIATGLAVLLTLLAHPQAPTTRWSWLIRGDLFAAVLTTELAFAVIVTAFFLGLSWRQWVTGMAIGLVLRFFVTVLVEGAHTYFGVGPLYKGLDHVRMYAEIAALVYWIVAFSRVEPVRQPPSPEILASLAAIGNTRWVQ